MTTTQGRVTRVAVKGPEQSSKGVAFYRIGFQLNDVDRWYNLLDGDRTKIRQGDEISFELEVNTQGFENINKKTLRTVVSSNVNAPVTTQTRTSNTGSATLPKTAKDNTLGMIKGNTVSGAIQLAIARKQTTLDGLKTAALDVLQLHGYLESQDITALMKQKTSTKADPFTNEALTSI